ncbi:MAG: hypothetical protein NUV59_02655 [Patescibacteria group bacterium]|nr:hypothetical protein [Patescibacteria group bacterium]
MYAADANNDPIRYAIDWDNNGAFDQYAPASGYVPSGTPMSVSHSYSSSGVKAVNARTEDATGRVSGFSPITSTCTYTPPPPPPPPTLSIEARPPLLPQGDTTIITWSSTNTDICTVLGDNGNSWSGVSGSETSSPIVASTLFTLSCTAEDGSSPSSSVRVDVIPQWQEI